jgi:hypothetical protein
MTSTISEITTGEATTLTDQIHAEQATYQQFRTEVRDAILEQHRTGEWCLPGSNEALHDLGLARIEHSYTGQVQITVDVKVHSAADLSQVATLLRDQLIVTSGGTAVMVRDYAVEQYASERLRRESDPR